MTGRSTVRTLGNGVIVWVVVIAAFGLMSSHFLEPANMVNIVTQSSSLAIVAVGMTCTLLTGGIDLSVGSTMFVAAAIAGKMLLAGMSVPAATCAALGVGLAFGIVNAVLVACLSMQPFIATLGTLFLGRGLALLITETRAMNLPERFARLGTERILGMPLPILTLALIMLCVHLLLSRTSLGRQIYAVGASVQMARKAGINTAYVLTSTYIICGLCAALGGLVTLALLGTVSQTFGSQREFAAVSAAVLGGTSLFGGRGKVLPGTVFGALLIQTVENGLVMVNADPYIYPLTSAAVIFATVMVDSLRHEQLLKLARRKIRMGGDFPVTTGVRHG
jgi:ribose transport system permease protein